MRILIINTVPTEKNGITNVIFNYLRAINNTRLIFDYVSINLPDPIYVNIVNNKGGKVYVINRQFSSIVSYFINIRKLISSNKYDVVHIHANSHTAVLELLASRMAGCKKCIIHSHNTSCKYVFIHKVLTPLFNSLYFYGFACGKKAGEWMFGNRDFKIIYNGVDTTLFSFNLEKRNEIRAYLGIEENVVLLGHVGAFITVKNQSFIVDILKELQTIKDNYKLLLIGDGSQRSFVESKVKQLGLSDSVLFTGNIDNVYVYLNAIDIVVMPSIFEGLPLTLIEQQANGLQCVISETITKEIDKTGNIFFLSLEESPSMWAQIISSIECKNARLTRSHDAIEKLKLCGYSILEEAKHLENFFIDINKES